MESIPPYRYNLSDGRLTIRGDYTVDTVRHIFDKYLEGLGA
jgi:site-specific DNA recombinase